MKQETRTELVSRDTILKMLSDDETGRVSTAETAVNLPKGDDYIDLEQLERGVQKATGKAPVMGHVLSRRAVHKDTWSKIVAEVTAHDMTKAPAGT
jgi:hypothetical protein